MLNIGGPELLIILLVALVVLGPERLPGAARQVGRTVNQLRSMAQGFQQELEAAAKPDLSPKPAGTDPEHIRTAAKATGAEMFGGTGADQPASHSDQQTQPEGSESSQSAAEKAVSAGGPAENEGVEQVEPPDLAAADLATEDPSTVADDQSGESE